MAMPVITGDAVAKFMPPSYSAPNTIGTMADSHHNGDGFIGASMLRREDPALITGAGRYVDDFQPAGTLHLALARSPYPHARITSIDVSAAKAVPGVLRVLTGADLPDHLDIRAPSMVPGMKIPPHPVLARESVHAVGTPVAAVVAETAAIARDAANLVEVEYDPL